MEKSRETIAALGGHSADIYIIIYILGYVSNNMIAGCFLKMLYTVYPSFTAVLRGKFTNDFLGYFISYQPKMSRLNHWISPLD
jgi:hypothetical protein